MIRVTLDSNIYRAALLHGGTSVPWGGFLPVGNGSRRHVSGRPIGCDPSEAIGVLRDKFHWEPYRLHFARIELLKFANLVQPTGTLNVTDDPDDNRILECAVAAAPDYIVSNDDDLMRLQEYRGIRIVSGIALLDTMRQID